MTDPEPTSDVWSEPLPAAVGSFRIEGRLGGGAMGVVYRAIAPDGARVAVKVLRATLSAPPLRRRFEREARVRIDHPNVVRVLDAGVDAATGTPYIALELLDGEALDARLERGPLSLGEVVDLGLQVSRGLAAAHAAGIVHRDLKPSNVFVCADGTIKIVDFGIALVTAAETRLTAEGGILGTPAYMSPEQVRGDRELDARADVWALGAVLYEAVTGRAAFLRDTPLATMLAIHMEEPEPIWSLLPNLPPGLVSAIERALAKAPLLRWSAIADLCDALAAVDVSVDVAHAPTDPPPPPQTPEAFDATVHAGQAAPPPARPSLLPIGEQRIVAVLLAAGVRDLAALSAAVEERGGVIIPLIGHRAIGLFGAEKWEGDEVTRAADAALAARGSAERISVASGKASSARAGGISGAVLRAAEEGCATALDGVAVDAQTARILAAAFAVAELRPGAWEIAGRHGEGVPMRSGDVPMVGREAELAQLRDVLRRVKEDGRRATALVVGSPGIGKSRLRRALEEELHAQGEDILVLVGRAEPLLRDRALSVLAAMLRSGLHADTGAGPPSAAKLTPVDRSAVARLAAEAFEQEHEALGCAEFLGELLGVPMPETPALRAARADPQLMVDRLRLAVLDYLEAVCSERPVALLLEDLQWADPASLDLLEEACDRLADAPLLVFATARPELLETRPTLFAGRDLVRIEPRGLIASDVATLAGHVAGRPLSEVLARALADRTGGHPLFVEQIVRELKDTGQLDAEIVELPSTLTVEAAVQSRLDHLPALEKDACKRASIFGRAFGADELEALGVTSAADVLGALGRRELVARARGSREGARQFAFKSALVADVVYGMIAEDPRRDLHRRAAAFLARRAAADDEEIARHHERGDEPDAASARYAAAAVAASARGDAGRVLACSDRALALGVAAEHAFALHMARADALRFLGRRDEQAEELARSKELADNDRDLARVLTEQTVLLSRTGQRAEALATADAAVAAAQRGGDVDVLAVARSWRVAALIYGGRLEDASAAFAETITGVESDPSTHARAALVSSRAHLAMALGDLGARRDAFREAATLYRDAGDLRRAAAAEVNLADVHNRVGAYGEAEAALRRALDGAQRVGNRTTQGYALVNLGYALLMQGRTGAALEALSEGEAIAERTRETRLRFVVRYYRLRTRAIDAAGEETSTESLLLAADAERAGVRAVAVLARAAAARALLVAKRVEDAALESRRALSELEEHGGIEEDEALVFLTHAQSLEALGLVDEAAQVRMRGRARLAAVAERIEDLDLRRRFLDDVAAHREL